MMAESRRDFLSQASALVFLASGAPTAKARNISRASGLEKTGFIEVPGGRVWYRRTGGGEKTPLLLLHGGPGAGSIYLDSMAALASGRAVIFYDQLGCGRSEAPEDDSLYRIPRFVEELETVRHALNLERVILFGNSWGTMLAIEYLLERGARGVEKLILSGALSSVPQAAAGMQRLLDAMPEGTGNRIRQLEGEKRTQSREYERLSGLFYRLHLCRRDPWPREMMATISILSKSPAYRVMNGPNEFTITGNIKDWDRSKDLQALQLPVLLTTGEFDEVTLDCHETIHNAISGSQLVVMKGCSHLTMLERPRAYNEIVGRFIA